MAIRVICQCTREIRAPAELAGKTVKCPKCGRNVAIPADAATSSSSPPREPTSDTPEVGAPPQSSLGQQALTALPFYWTQRKALRSVLGELIQPLRSPQDLAREIRISPAHLERIGKRTSTGWVIELPDCCIVCGELTNTPATSDSRDAWDLTWPVVAPAAVVSFGLLASLLLCTPWLFLLAVPLAPLAGALVRRKSTIGLSVWRCDQHRNRLDLPQLWSFGNTLVVRTGDAQVVEAFHEPDRLVHRRQQQALALHEQQQAGDKAAAGAIAMAEIAPRVSAAARKVTAPSQDAHPAESSQRQDGFELAPQDVAPPVAERRCRSCGAKLLPHESACPRCHTRTSPSERRTTAARKQVSSGTFEDEDEAIAEPPSVWAAIGKLILSLTELALTVMLFSILGAGAAYFAQRWELTTRAGIDLDRFLLAGYGIHPLATAATYASALGLMLYYGATGLAIRNGVLLALLAVGLAWYFNWPWELWLVGLAAALVGMALGVLQAMFESRFAEPLGVLLAPGRGMLPGRPSSAGLIALAKGVLAGGFCGALLGTVVGYPVYLYGKASGWEVGQQGAVRFALGCGMVAGIALAYLAGQFAMTKAERVGAWRGMLLGAQLWGFSTLVAMITAIGLTLAKGTSDRSPWQMVTIALLIVAGASVSGALVGLISGAVGGKRNRAVIPKIR
jgi:uncharacterized OB-fold protein